MSLKLGTQDIAGISTHTNVNAHSLFDFKWADHRLNEVSWLEASTFSWQSGGVYVTAYNHLVADLQGITAETETIGSYTVTFYRATDGHKICLADQEQTVLNIYNETGIAWYYILDTTNQRFKLPRTKYGFEGLRGNVGDKIDESLPNIKGSFGVSKYEAVWGSGCFSSVAGSANAGADIVNNNAPINTLDASRSSSAYQDNAPVQERATQMYLYFYVGDYSQTAIEQTAGINSELFNGKADVDLTNVNNSGTSRGAGWAMPSDRYIDLTLGASGATYTAPANGWVLWDQQLPERNGIWVNVYNQENQYLYGTATTAAVTSGTTIFLPVMKGYHWAANYTGGTVNKYSFIYAEGSKWEAQ